MNCTLCSKPIEAYNPEFHYLHIDETHSARICPECTLKFTAWQTRVIAKLFPTKAMKKLSKG